MCLVSFQFDTSTHRRKAPSSSSHFFRLYKHRPLGPIGFNKVRRQPPPPAPPNPEPVPKDPKLSSWRGKQENVPIPLGAADFAHRRRSGNPARSSDRGRSSVRARSSSRGDKHGRSDRTSKEKKERKKEPDVEPCKEDEGLIAERMQDMHLQHLYNEGDQAKAQPHPHTRPPSWLPGSNVSHPSSASEAYYQGAGIQVQDFQHESQPRDALDGFHTLDFIQPEEHVWTWLKGGDGSYILAAACSCPLSVWEGIHDIVGGEH